VKTNSDRYTGTRLVLLGTMAGPVFHPDRFMTSQIVFVNGCGYMVDCGQGALARMNEMRIPLPRIKSMLFTHHHSDHTADYPAFVNMAWIMRPPEPVAVFGPEPIKDMHHHAVEFFRKDSDIRIAATGRDQVEHSFKITEIVEPGLILENNDVKITAAKVNHPPFELALAYRFDTADGSIVLSGDTTPVDEMARLAKGADILVHEAMFRPGIRAMLDKRDYVPPFLYDFLIDGHTDASAAGEIAAKAGVKTLVLSHLLPGDQDIADDVWINEARAHFDGSIVIAKDKMILTCDRVD